MAQGYSVSVGLIDNITKPIEAINKRLSALSAPMQRFSKSLDKFKDLSGLKLVGDGFRKLGDFAGSALRTFTSMVPVLGALTGGAILAGVLKLALGLGQFGTHLQLTSTLLGTSVPKLQVMENAFRLMGGTAADADQNIQGLSDAMQSAMSNRNPVAANMFQKLGIDISAGAFKAKSGAEKLQEVMDKIHAMYKSGAASDSTLREIGHNLGLSDFAISAAENGDHSSSIDRAERMGTMSPEDAKKARDFAQSITAVQTAFENMSNTILAAVSPVFTPLLNQFQEFLTANQSLVRDKVGEWAKDFGKWISEIDFKKVVSDVGDFITKVDNIVQALGGWKQTTEELFALWVGAKFLGMMASIGSLVTVLTNPVTLAALATWAGFKAASSEGNKAATNDEMARQLGYTIGDVDPNTGNPTYYKDKDGRMVMPDDVRKNYGDAGGRDGAIKAKPELDAAAKSAFDWWTSHGLSPAAASGMVAQEETESGFRPGAIGDGGTAKGSFQWHRNRRDAIYKGTGIDVWNDSDAESQHRAALWELKNTEKTAGDHLMASKTPEEAGAIGSREYERPGDVNGEASRRAALARQRMNQFSINTPDASTTNGKVDVGVTFNNTPPGTKVNSKASGNVNASAPRVMTPMTGF